MFSRHKLLYLSELPSQTLEPDVVICYWLRREKGGAKLQHGLKQSCLLDGS